MGARREDRRVSTDDDSSGLGVHAAVEGGGTCHAGGLRLETTKDAWLLPSYLILGEIRRFMLAHTEVAMRLNITEDGNCESGVGDTGLVMRGLVWS